MVTFKINLLKDQVVTKPVRRTIFRALVAYIAVSGCVLVLLSYRATAKLQSAFQSRHEILRLEAGFRAHHPGSRDIVTYGRHLSQKLDELSASLQAINAACETRIELARILLAISAPLPASVNITALELSQERQLFGFEVDFPIESANETIDATQLLQIWNSDPTLAAQVGRISSVKSQKRNYQGRYVENWRFAGSRLAGGK